MASSWYSKKLHVSSRDAIAGIVTGFIKPLIAKLDEEGAEFRFHFFRYSNGSPFLRLRIRGESSVLGAVEEYEQANLSGLDANSEPEAYDLTDALQSGFRNADEAEKGWLIYEAASRIALETASQGFSEVRLREGNYGLGVGLNHLFLNSMGYSIGEEYLVHRLAMSERAVVLLILMRGQSEGAVRAQFATQLNEFNQLLDRATAVLNDCLGTPPSP